MFDVCVKLNSTNSIIPNGGTCVNKKPKKVRINQGFSRVSSDLVIDSNISTKSRREVRMKIKEACVQSERKEEKEGDGVHSLRL